jgi:AraC-like DNA-binding protein
MSDDGVQLESLGVRRFLAELIYGTLSRAVRGFRAEAHRHPLSYSTRVYDALVQQESARELRMSNVARKLGLSERTLRRYLLAEGKSYVDILDMARGTVAKSSLRNESRTIGETARELGLSPSGFHRAFKRWTGITPSEYRRQQAQ